MPILIKNNEEVDSVFDLLGSSEDDMTASIAWTLSCNSPFLEEVLRQLLSSSILNQIDLKNVQILNQSYSSNNGITDIEILQPNLFHIIIEAKKGWGLPDESQLVKYVSRFSSVNQNNLLVTLSECTHHYFKHKFPAQKILNIPLQHMSWEDLYGIAKSISSSQRKANRLLLEEMINYLEKVVHMQKTDSNWVYVVSLSDDKPDGWDISWKEIVEEKNYYFHPTTGGGWPKTPPNYIAFRYDGQLQSIHHIESYEIIDDFNTRIGEIPSGKIETHFLYTLGTPITPQRVVKNGPKVKWAHRTWCMLDTLLTSNTITEAREKSVSR